MSRPTARRRRIGHLDCTEIPGTDDGPVVILLHGYGADMNDLAPLSGVIQAPKGTTWIFPNGQHKVPLGEHMEGRGWFPITLSQLERSMAGGEPIDLSTLVPPGLKKSRELVIDLIKKLDRPFEKIVLGGFSQGAMLATDVALHLEKPPAGLALLSTTLVCREEWQTRAPQFKGLRFFQSHGSRDPVLSFAMAEKLTTLLTQAGWLGKLQRFEGGHEIPSDVLISLGNFIRQVIK